MDLFYLFILGFSKLDALVFIDKNLAAPSVLKFHPYDPHLAVAEKESVRYRLVLVKLISINFRQE